MTERGRRCTKIVDSYAQHPLRAATLLQRLAPLDRRVTQWELSIDPKTEITDQNHVGGWRSTLEMACAAALGEGAAVVDLGCGLGGPARLIAEAFGSTVHGVDLSPQRCDDARSLTELVGLSRKVSFECADLEVAEPPDERYDVLWGQDAWAQIEDREGFLARWCKVLRPGGMIACQEIVLLRPASNRQERRALDRLRSIWNARLDPFVAWSSALAGVGASACVLTQQTTRTSEHFARLSRCIPPGLATPEERLAWEEAIRCADAGLLGSVRWITRVRPQ